MGRTAFGDWLEARIRERDWTLRQAADHLGIEQSSVSRYINGISAPNRQNLRKIAEGLDVPRDELEALVDRPRSSPRTRPGGIEGAGDITDALADPRLPVAFYGLLDAWPDMTTEEQEDTLATIAHRYDDVRRRKDAADADRSGGGGA